MSVTTATRPQVAIRDFTETEMRRYFSKPPTWPLPTAIIGGLFFLLGLAISSNSGFFNCVTTIGLVLLAVAGIAYYTYQAGTQPTDEEYDSWVERKLAAHEPEARKALSLFDPNNQIVGPTLRVDGIIVPTAQTLQSYSGARAKKGKDGIWRFSINTVKYFYPEEHKLGAYSDIVNALSQSVRSARTEEFFYSDIVGARTEDQSVAAIIDPTNVKSGRPVTVTLSTKTFRLIASSGDSTGQTVDVASVTDGRSTFRRGDVVEQTVGSLRKLLDDKKGGAQQAQRDLQKQQTEMQQQMQQQMLEMQQQMLEQMKRMAEQGNGNA